MTLTAVERFEVPAAIAARSIELMRDAGRRGAEIFIAWAGVRCGSRFVFRRMIVPRQTPLRTPRGLLVRIEGQALFELNRDCHQHGDTLAGQIHAHPDSAYHSQADDDLAIVRTLGGLSLVVPRFARDGLRGLDRWACLQLTDSGRWTGLRPGVEVVIT